MFRRLSTLVVALVVTLLPVAAKAQTGNSNITGLVNDRSGGAVPGATIKVTNEATGVTFETVTPPTSTGTRCASGVSAPVRPT